MDKLGVDESSQVPDSLEKKAAKDCPKCGAKLEHHGNVAQCPNCGTEPFEEAK